MKPKQITQKIPKQRPTESYFSVSPYIGSWIVVIESRTKPKSHEWQVHTIEFSADNVKEALSIAISLARGSVLHFKNYTDDDWDISCLMQAGFAAYHAKNFIHAEDFAKLDKEPKDA